MIISISTGAFYSLDYKKILSMISMTSCKNIKIFLNQAFRDISFDEIATEVAKNNLNVLSIHAPLGPLVQEKESEKYWINRSLELAHILGAGVIVTHDTFHFDQNKKVFSVDEEHKENLIAFSKSSIPICTENVHFMPVTSILQSPEELLPFITMHQIGITFDVSHWGSTNKDIIDGYYYFNEFIRNIHISDNLNGVEHKILGTGNLPLARFIKMLQKENYNNPLTIELDLDNPERNNVKTEEDAIKAMEHSYNFILNSLN
ncbi:MAG: TIM barrel protein [Eubacteriales bacterium]|nr:TIM barrel protein [Eubacteriales bacterium]